MIELETAHMLAQTIESASGRPVGIYSAQDFPKDVRVAAIAVGAAKPPRPDVLSIGTAARRVGLVKKQVPAGADVANLP